MVNGMRKVLVCLCFLLDGIAATCLSSLTCSASSSVAFNCDASITLSSSVKHCCCTNSDRFCSYLSDCNAWWSTYPDTQCRWAGYRITGKTQTFSSGGAWRYRQTMNGAHNFIDVQVWLFPS
jgi:hypothetical protein